MIVLSGLLRVVPREPKEVPAVLTLVRKDWEGEARRLEEEELEGVWRLARRAPNPPAVFLPSWAATKAAARLIKALCIS